MLIQSACPVDLEKVFDLVARHLLPEVLQEYGVSGGDPVSGMRLKRLKVEDSVKGAS